MSDIYRCMIITAADAPLARLICSTLGGMPYEGMFEVGLSPTGDEPATHYISSGGISKGFAALIPFTVWAQDPDGQWVEVSHDPGKPAKTFELCQEAGLDVTLEDIEVLYAFSDVTAENPWAAMARMGLQLVRQPEPTTELRATDKVV